MTSLDEVENWLAGFVPKQKNITGKDITLDRMRPLMELFGNPQDKLKVVHVAGTSGKTSTSYYIAALLTFAGKKTGLTVSPHIDTVRERAQLNMQPASEEKFTESMNEFREILGRSDLEPTYFELIICFAYWYFYEQGVDYAVIETGLGGLHDGTNIVESPDKVCVITDIGLDHMHVLGDTVPKIAMQKAGIIHTGNTVFMNEQPDEVTKVIKARCDEAGADLKIVHGLPAEHAGPVMAGFQERNFMLAKAVFGYIKQRDGLPDTDEARSSKVVVPGRMNKVLVGDKSIVMDGAHNEQKMRAFVSSFMKEYPGRKVPVLLALKQGKELASVLPLLKPLASKLILTEYSAVQDLPVEAIDASELAAAARKFGFEDIQVCQKLSEAYAVLIEDTSDVAVVTGSFYLIGQLRQLYGELKR